jgi:hypothetical protein
MKRRALILGAAIASASCVRPDGVTKTATPAPGDAVIASLEPVRLVSSAATERIDRAIETHYKTSATHRSYVMTDKPLYQPGESIWFRVDLRATGTLLDARERVSDFVDESGAQPRPLLLIPVAGRLDLSQSVRVKGDHRLDLDRLNRASACRAGMGFVLPLRTDSMRSAITSASLFEPSRNTPGGGELASNSATSSSRSSSGSDRAPANTRARFMRTNVQQEPRSVETGSRSRHPARTGSTQDPLLDLFPGDTGLLARQGYRGTSIDLFGVVDGDALGSFEGIQQHRRELLALLRRQGQGFMNELRWGHRVES